MAWHAESRFTTVARGFVKALDALVRRLSGIFEYCEEPDCLLRLGLGHSEVDIVLSDGTHIRPGELVGEIHLWNERVPQMSDAGPDLNWGVHFYRGMLASLRDLSAYVQTDRRFAPVQAYRGEVAVFQTADVGAAARLLQRAGFDVQYPQAPRDWLGRFQRFWKNLYTWWLMWTFQPTTLHGKAFGRMTRFYMWISRAELLARYGEEGVTVEEERS